MTGNVTVNQTVAEVLEASGSAQVNQVVAETVVQDQGTPVRVNQTVLEVVTAVPNTPRVNQVVLEVLCNLVNAPAPAYVSVMQRG